MPQRAEPSHEYLHPLIYADPGVGKTVLAASGKDTLIIHPPMDNIGSALRLGYQFDHEVVHDWNDMTNIYEFLRHEKHTYKWAWLDSISLGQDEWLHSIMVDLVSEKPHREIEIPDQREYLINFKRELAWIRDMINLPMNFGITAHPELIQIPDEDDPEETVDLFMPWVQGKQMPQKVCGYMNIVGYLDVSEDKEGAERRVLYTTRRKHFYAKDQFGAFGGRLIDPTVPKMEKIVRDSMKGEEPSSPDRSKRRKTTAKKPTARTRSK